MTKQVTVRLPEELVEFIDRCVSEGTGASRAAVIAAAVDRERRRAVAERDVAILLANAEDDLDALARYGAQVAMPDLD